MEPDTKAEEQLAVRLVNTLHIDYPAALAAVRNGTALAMLEAVEQHEYEVKNPPATPAVPVGQCTRADGSPLPVNPKPGDRFAGVLDKDALILSLGDRIKKQSELLSIKAEKPPGQATLNKIVADVKRNAEEEGLSVTEAEAVLAQTSEPGSVATGARRLYFVCRKCLGGFVVEPGVKGVVECQCGAAQFGDDGEAPFSEMGIRLCTEAALEVTELVECGKLSAVLPTPDAERFPWLVLFAVHNRTNRNVPQRRAVDVVRAASDGVKAGVLPATDYIHRAAIAGARVQWHSHYHVRKCGIDKHETGDYVRNEATGDARFAGSVIVRDQKNEADGSLLFTPVIGCARCGKDHTQPVAFWKLTRPVYHTTVAVEGLAHTSELIATHFGTCPDTGEPIMMISSMNTEEEEKVFENAAEAEFTKPAPGGRVEGSVNTIDSANPIGGAEPQPLTTVPGMSNTEAHEAGRNAGLSAASITSDPHPHGSRLSEEWRSGFVEGRSQRYGE